MQKHSAEEFEPEKIEVKYAVALELTEQALNETKDARALAKARGSYKKRTMRFYDTKTLAFFHNDLILRTRVPAKDGKDPDSTVKVRGPRAAKRDWVAELEFDPDKLEAKREGDLVLSRKPEEGDKYRPAISLTGKQKRHEIEDADKLGDAKSKKREELARALFKDAQETLVEEIFGKSVPWENLEVAGPVEAEVWEWNEPNLNGREVTRERWVVKGKAIVEFSCKVDPGEEGNAAAGFFKWLGDFGLTPMDTSKARWVLKQFLSNKT